MNAFDAAFAAVVGIEGSYVDDPMDSGGATMYGITQRVAQANGYVGALRSMPLGVAQSIYRQQYWDLLHLDDVAQSNIKIALELFDTAVNCGIGTAGRYLQRALNALNRGSDYPDVQVDGVVGPMSVSALRRFLAVRGDNGETVLLRALNALQGAGYIDLAESTPKDKRFVFGWLLNRVAM